MLISHRPILTVCLVLFLANLALSAPSTAPRLRLTGILNFPEMKCAVLEQAGPLPIGELWYILQPGQKEGAVELLEIHPETGAVTVNFPELGGATNLTFTNVVSGQNAGVLFENANLDPVLKLYGDLVGRTLLRHPSLPRVLVTLSAAARDKAEAAGILERNLSEKDIVTIRDGKNFLMVVPQGLAKSITPHSAELKPAEKSDATEILPPGAINFPNTDSTQVMPIYAELVGRRLDRTFSLPVPPSFVVKFQNQTPLSRTELIYALDTLFAWSGVKMVPVNTDQIKAVPLIKGK